MVSAIQQMLATLQTQGRPLSEFKKGDRIHVHNKMVSGYEYTLTEAPNSNFDPEFKPHYSPAEILRLGAFEGKYLNDCIKEFPAEWFIDAIGLDKLRPEKADISVNCFQILSRQPLSVWRAKDWAPHKGGKPNTLGDPSFNPDERGWFQWYCRYWLGRRIPALDSIEIKRWKAFRRHLGAVKKNCTSGDFTCRPRQRQALLHWAYNPFV